MTCRGQLGRVSEAIATLPADVRDRLVFVALSVESDLPPEDLQAYAEREGFPFVYAVMPAEMQRAFAEEYGREALIPSMMPHLTIGADGEVSDLHLGALDPDQIAEKLTALSEPAAS